MSLLFHTACISIKSLQDYKLALTIFTISKRCYHYIRNHHILPLPSYTCLKRHLVEDTPIRREVEQFLASESQCNCGQENCQHNLAFPINTAANTETVKKVIRSDFLGVLTTSICEWINILRAKVTVLKFRTINFSFVLGYLFKCVCEPLPREIFNLPLFLY